MVNNFVKIKQNEILGFLKNKISVKNRNSSENPKCSPKIVILAFRLNRHFEQKSDFGLKSKFSPKIGISVKNQILANNRILVKQLLKKTGALGNLFGSGHSKFL